MKKDAKNALHVHIQLVDRIGLLLIILFFKILEMIGELTKEEFLYLLKENTRDTLRTIVHRYYIDKAKVNIPFQEFDTMFITFVSLNKLDGDKILADIVNIYKEKFNIVEIRNQEGQFIGYS